jgi:hypothetical protein
LSNFNDPVDIAWRAYLAILKQEGLSREEMSIAQQSYKDGWHECERHLGQSSLPKTSI